MVFAAYAVVFEANYFGILGQYITVFCGIWENAVEFDGKYSGIWVNTVLFKTNTLIFLGIYTGIWVQYSGI